MCSLGWECEQPDFTEAAATNMEAGGAVSASAQTPIYSAAILKIYWELRDSFWATENEW